MEWNSGTDRGQSLAKGEPWGCSTLFSRCEGDQQACLGIDEGLVGITAINVHEGLVTVGTRVQVLVLLWVWDADNTFLDFFHAPCAHRPTWRYLSTLRPQGHGRQVLTKRVMMTRGQRQAVRVVFRHGGLPTPVARGLFDDQHDLVIPVIQ